MNGQKLEEVGKFKYLVSTLSKNSKSSAEVCTRIDKVSAAMARLNLVGRSNKNQLSYQIQAVQITGGLYPPVWL